MGRRSRCRFMASAVQLDFGGRDRLDQAGKFNHQLSARAAGEVRRYLHEEPSHANDWGDATDTVWNRSAAVHDHKIENSSIAYSRRMGGRRQKIIACGLVVRCGRSYRGKSG